MTIPDWRQAVDAWKPIPSTIRTARKQHICNECGDPIEPGEKYELTVVPPHRVSEYDVGYWVSWRSHHPRFGPQGQFLLGCHVSAAYREDADRSAALACTMVAIVGDTTYHCRSHEDGVHNFGAHWPACRTAWCRLAPGHSTLHDIPSGTPEFQEAVRA